MIYLSRGQRVSCKILRMSSGKGMFIGTVILDNSGRQLVLDEYWCAWPVEDLTGIVVVEEEGECNGVR